MKLDKSKLKKLKMPSAKNPADDYKSDLDSMEGDDMGKSDGDDIGMDDSADMMGKDDGEMNLNDKLLEDKEEDEGMDLDGDNEEGESEEHKDAIKKKDPLAMSSDEDLLAEVKKRGLMKDLDKGLDADKYSSNEDEGDQSVYS